ncbi:flagellin [Ethanoligenens sp.]|uniref:flagellin N-terminal helical domain-containing protein n=1 Tax=Ethanoligenens sp. TaxID=2099655 RepID=UPI0039EC9745
MVINHNIAALNTFSNLQKNTAATQDSLQKLSTGSKINKAADDASGLAISQKMQAQINGLDQAQENVSNGTSLVQTAEGALGNVQDILQKMRTLANQAQNQTQNTTDTSNLQDQANALAQEINRISAQTTYNTKNVLSSTAAGDGLFTTSGIQIQIGADSGQVIDLTLSGSVSGLGGVDIASLGVAGLSTASASDYTTVTALDLTASSSINTIQSAIDDVSKLRSKLGAYQNRMSYASDTLGIESQNLTAAESTITDTDVAQEMMNYTKNNILVQSAQAMLAQANQLPQGMLSLLKS